MAKDPFNRAEVIHNIPASGGGRRALEQLLETSEALQEKPNPLADTHSATDDHRNAGADDADHFQRIPIDRVYPGRFQPRFHITPESIDDLAADIIQVGRLLNPISVRPDAHGRYEIIGGERRWLACKQLGWADIPAMVYDADVKTAILAGLSDNIQRQDLSEMEIGFYLKRMIDEQVASSKKELAIKVGMERRDLYRYLAFTELPGSVQAVIRNAPYLFGVTTSEAMLDLCNKGYEDRVVKAAQMILDGTLNMTAIRSWVLSPDRVNESARRFLVMDGARIGTVSFSREEMRIRLSPAFRDMDPDHLATLVAEAIRANGNRDARSTDAGNEHE